jgi:hypothetical protein
MERPCQVRGDRVQSPCDGVLQRIAVQSERRGEVADLKAPAETFLDRGIAEHDAPLLVEPEDRSSHLRHHVGFCTAGGEAGYQAANRLCDRIKQYWLAGIPVIAKALIFSTVSSGANHLRCPGACAASHHRDSRTNAPMPRQRAHR